MDNLNNIPNAGNWGDAASKLNDNFNKIKQSLTTVENTSKNNKGYFSSLSALNSAFPSPKTGQTAYVHNETSSTKYYIYNAVNGAWVTASVEAPAVAVNIADYTKSGGSSKTTKQVEDEIVQLAGEVVKNENSPYGSELSVLYAPNPGWLGANSWLMSNADSKHIVIPVIGRHLYNITANNTGGAFFYILKSYTQPTSTGEIPDFSDSYRERIAIPRGTSLEITMPDDANFLVVSQTSDGEINNKPTVNLLTLKNISKIKADFEKLNSVTGVDISDYNYTSNPGWLSTNSWDMHNANSRHIVIPILGNIAYNITANNTGGAFFYILKSYTQPTSTGEIPDFSDSYRERIAIPRGTSLEITMPDDANFLVVSQTSDGEINNKPVINMLTLKSISNVAKNTAIINKNANVHFFETAQILSNKDEAAILDVGRLGYFNIIQMKEDLFYMYYSGMETNNFIPDEYQVQKLLFAHSTDGLNWIREFPAGVNAPFPGTNKVFENFTGQCVFKCLDKDYPFRLITQIYENDLHIVNMYKSVDAFNFDISTKRTLFYEYHDTQPSVICRGNVMKVFTRMRSSTHNRRIGIAYFDLDGNKLSPIRMIDGDYLYNSAAVAIDDRHELIFPSYFNNGSGDDSYSFKCYLVDGYSVEELTTNINDIVDMTVDKWAIFSPSILTIGGDQYLAFYTNNRSHDTSLNGEIESKYMLVRIEISR